jgi:hypothetical protein
MTQQPSPAPRSAAAGKAGHLAAVRRRLVALYADPQTAGLRAGLRPPTPRPATSAEGAVGASMADTLARLGFDAPVRSVLATSLTMHDGRIVAMAGDPARIGPDADTRVVTMTTTVLDSSRMSVETSVQVFTTSAPTGKPQEEDR